MGNFTFALEPSTADVPPLEDLNCDNSIEINSVVEIVHSCQDIREKPAFVAMESVEQFFLSILARYRLVDSISVARVNQFLSCCVGVKSIGA